MVNKEHLYILNQGIKKWNNQVKNNLFIPDLRGADLSGAKLNIANLNNADLGGANLGGANLKGTYLSSKELDPKWHKVWEIVNQKVKSNNRSLFYEDLEYHLKNGRWQEADGETYRLMTQVMGKDENEWLAPEEIKNFPCDDLRTINQLWLKYSNGKFGFSVQKEIYESLGGTAKFSYDMWENFCDRVGWRKEFDGKIEGRPQWRHYTQYTQLTFNLNANKAHLPLPPVPRYAFRTCFHWGMGSKSRPRVQQECFCSLLQRLLNCEI